MAQIKHVKDLPIVEPSDVKFFVLKNGQMCQTELGSIIEKVKNFDPVNINASFEKAEKLITELSIKLEAAEKKIEELKGVLDAMVVEAVSVQVEENENSEETPKRPKRNKKVTE